MQYLKGGRVKMNKEKNIKHEFNLQGMNTGDIFMGCMCCWNQYSVGAATYPLCDRCRGRLSLLTVTEQDKKIKRGEPK